MKAKQIILRSRPQGMPVKDNFAFEDIHLREIKDGEVLLKAKFISVDAYMRGRMNESNTFIWRMK